VAREKEKDEPMARGRVISGQNRKLIPLGGGLDPAEIIHKQGEKRRKGVGVRLARRGVDKCLYD